MNAISTIDPQTTKSATLWREPSLPDRLNALLDQRLPLADMPVIGPKSTEALRAYVASCTPPLPRLDQVENMLTKLSIVMAKAQASEAEASQRLDIYWQALRHHALPDLQAVFIVLLRTCKFFPSIAEIEDAIAPIRAKRMARVNRAGMLILKHEREWSEPIADMADAEQVAAVVASVEGRA